MSPAQAAGAASVVTHLLSFLREPRYRAQYTSARASLEGGHHVFKFAQGKFPPGLAHDLPTHEREELRRAAVTFIRAVCFREGATHYQVLCMAPGAKREAIKENYHLLMALIHPDRAEGSPETWPADWAQRVNRAYAVLADDAARTSYDEGLGAFDAIRPGEQRPARAPGARPMRRRGSKASTVKMRFAKALLVLATVMATLLALDAWVEDTPRELFAFNAASRGRDINASVERPRFLGANLVPARDGTRDALPPANEPKIFTPLAPLWRGLSGSPALETLPARLAPSVRPAAPVAAPESQFPIADGAASSAASEISTPPPGIVVQAAPSSPSVAASRLTSAQIELVMARLISYYEAGETDNLMALLDEEVGVWQTARIRQAYGDFFRATRQRRLRVTRLDWQAASVSAHAQGQATVQAEYFDAPWSLVRDIDVEMDIALRNGQAKITRLSLFPSGP